MYVRTTCVCCVRVCVWGACEWPARPRDGHLCYYAELTQTTGAVVHCMREFREIKASMSEQRARVHALLCACGVCVCVRVREQTRVGQSV